MMEKNRDVEADVREAIERGEDERERALAVFLRGVSEMGLVPERDAGGPWNELPEERKDRWLRFARVTLVATDRLAQERLPRLIVNAVMAQVEAEPVTEHLASFKYDYGVAVAEVTRLLREAGR